jgi:hypothetical protein
MTKSVFLSHSVRDVKWLEEINKEFIDKDLDLYIAEQDIQPGYNLLNKIEDAIKKCDMFVVLISKRGSRSKWVQSEIGIAIASKKRIVPIIEKGVNVPPQLLGKEFIRLDPEEPEGAIDSLKTFLSKSKDDKEREEWIRLSDTILVFAVVILGIVLIAALLSRK